MLALLLTLALAAPPAPAPDPARPVCLTPAEVATRILEPLSALVRCQEEVAITVEERDALAGAAAAMALDLRAEQAARAAADERARRARRQRPTWAGGGSLGTLAIVVLLVVLL
jgi:hypothetical protein